MKKTAILILSIGVSFSMLGQRSELKNAEKLIKSEEFAKATESLQGVESLALNTKYEAYYYFLEGKSAFGNETTHDYERAGKFFYKTLDVEYRLGKKDYSEKAINYINTIAEFYYNSINKTIESEDYVKTGEMYEILYNIRPERKDLLDLILYCHIKSKNFTQAAEIIETLLKSSGTTIYSAKNKHTSKSNDFFTEADRDKAVIQKTHVEPDEAEEDPSVRIGYYTNLAAIYDQQGNFEKEIGKLKEAKKEFPNHAPFYENYAAVIYKTGDDEAYVEALEDVLTLTPDKADSWFNLGVISQNAGQIEKALMAYDKVIELDPNYRDAYINKGLIILTEEKSLVTKLNNSRGTKKYSVIKDQIKDIYEKAIPYFEKAYSIKKDEDVKANLKGLYIAIEDTAKAKAL